MGFVFYDTETTGLHTAYSQILQFAAIRTDDNLNEMERFEIRSRLLPHVVPSPYAMKITGITAKQLTDINLPTHYQMICAIKEKLKAWSPAIFIGYNTLDYDEHLLRQAFYQNLHPPYLTNTIGNSRSDVLRMALTASLFAPDVLKIPLNDKQQPVFKLDRIASYNGFNHANAHEAISDVEATIFMCRLIKDRAPKVWDCFMRFSNKKAVTDHVLTEPIFSLSDFFFNKPHSWLVTSIGNNPDRNYEMLVFDLAFDPEALGDLPTEKLITTLKQSPKPVRTIKPNASPVLMHLDDAPNIAAAKALGIDELRRRVQSLRDSNELRERIVAAYNMTKDSEKEPSPHIEEQIYAGFSSIQDQKRLDAFHNIAWNERVALLAQFEDERHRTLAKRLIYFECPELLEETVRKEHDVAIAKRLLADETTVPWLTLPKAIAEMETMLETIEPEKREFMREHREFLLDRLQQLHSLIA